MFDETGDRKHEKWYRKAQKENIDLMDADLLVSEPSEHKKQPWQNTKNYTNYRHRIQIKRKINDRNDAYKTS